MRTEIGPPWGLYLMALLSRLLSTRSSRGASHSPTSAGKVVSKQIPCASVVCCAASMASGHEGHQIGLLPLQRQVMTRTEAGCIDHGVNQPFHRARRCLNGAQTPGHAIGIDGRSLVEAAPQ